MTVNSRMCKYILVHHTMEYHTTVRMKNFNYIDEMPNKRKKATHSGVYTPCNSIYMQFKRTQN